MQAQVKKAVPTANKSVTSTVPTLDAAFTEATADLAIVSKLLKEEVNKVDGFDPCRRRALAAQEKYNQ